MAWTAGQNDNRPGLDPSMELKAENLSTLNPSCHGEAHLRESSLDLCAGGILAALVRNVGSDANAALLFRMQIAMPFPGAAQTFLKSDPRLVTKHALDSPDIGLRIADIPGTRRIVPWPHVPP